MRPNNSLQASRDSNCSTLPVWERIVRKKIAKILLGAAFGSVVLGLLCYCVVHTTMRPQGMGGGMGGWGHALDSFLAGAGGALVGLVGGGFLAYWLDRNKD